MKALLEKFRNLRVLVAGDVMLDEYIWGDSHRISPEAPVPVVAVNKKTDSLGGAANVALNLVALGAKAELCGWVGPDSAGERLGALLAKAGVAFDSRFVRHGVTTIVKTRIVVRRQQLCRLDREEGPNAYALEGTDATSWIAKKLESVDAVIFSDYSKGALDTRFVNDIASKASGKGIFTALDPKPRRPIEVKGLDLLTPNYAEALELAGYSPDIPRDIQPTIGEVVSRIYDKYDPRFLVITRGADGMSLSAREGGKSRVSIDIIPTYAREVFDVTGAGDTVIAALTLALKSGAQLKEAAHIANTAAGVVVGKFGTATATSEEILNYHP